MELEKEIKLYFKKHRKEIKENLEKKLLELLCLLKTNKKKQLK